MRPLHERDHSSAIVSLTLRAEQGCLMMEKTSRKLPARTVGNIDDSFNADQILLQGQKLYWPPMKACLI